MIGLRVSFTLEPRVNSKGLGKKDKKRNLDSDFLKLLKFFELLNSNIDRLFLRSSFLLYDLGYAFPILC